MSNYTGFWAVDNFLEDLQKEIKLHSEIVPQKTIGNLVITSFDQSSQSLPASNPKQATQLAWAQNTWNNIERIEFKSISNAVRQLKERGKFWHHTGGKSFRRGQLILEQLPKWKIKPLAFGDKMSSVPLGHFTLENESTLWASADCSSSYPDGEIKFVEDKINPPSRAYLKLWEFFSVSNRRPKPGEICVDLGACPGGWTWVLASLGAQVTSVDKAPLDARLMNQRNIHYISQDAFAIPAGDLNRLGVSGLKIDWLCSDIICYPPKLLELVKAWHNSGLVRNFVITIKFQGETDFETLEGFKKIKNSKVTHLAHNKHELTWSLLE